MKTKCILLFLVCTLLSCELRSLQEDYRPMIVEGYEWTIQIEAYPNGPGIDEDTIIDIQRIEGDSIIGKHTYKKMLSKIEGRYDQWKVVALLREDVKKQRVYLWIDGEERLYYDFGLRVGGHAQLYVHEFIPDGTVQLNKITQKKDTQGKPYRLFHYTITDEEGYNYDYIVYERFGSSTGILYNYVGLDGDARIHIKEARDEHGNVILTDKNLP